MSYSISAIEDIDADEAEALRSLGIRTTERLLEATKSSSRQANVAPLGVRTWRVTLCRLNRAVKRLSR